MGPRERDGGEQGKEGAAGQVSHGAPGGVLGGMAEHQCDPVHVAEAGALRAKGWRPPQPGTIESIRVLSASDPIGTSPYYEVCQECGVTLN